MESYLLSCPLLVIAWKLFKGLSPTLVALLAIFLNDRNARKRDLKNKIVDMKYNILTEVLNSLYNLEKDVIYIMERVVDLIELRKEIENLSGDDIDECIEKIKIIGNQSFEKLSYLMIQKNYFST